MWKTERVSVKPREVLARQRILAVKKFGLKTVGTLCN